MDAVEYIKARERMCAFYGTGCNCCPLVDRPYGESCDSIDPHGAVVLVEQWAKEHPVMTNAVKFKEVFGRDIEDCLIDPKLYGMSTTWWDDEYKEPPKEET